MWMAWPCKSDEPHSLRQAMPLPSAFALRAYRDRAAFNSGRLYLQVSSHSQALICALTASVEIP